MHSPRLARLFLPIAIVFTIGALVVSFAHAASSRPPPDTAIVDASEFLHEIPPGDTIADAAQFDEGAWRLNNPGLTLRTKQEAVVRVAIADAGTCHLFVRGTASAGTGGSFEVTINGKGSGSTFGEGPHTLRDGGTFELPSCSRTAAARFHLENAFHRR